LYEEAENAVRINNCLFVWWKVHSDAGVFYALTRINDSEGYKGVKMRVLTGKWFYSID